MHAPRTILPQKNPEKFQFVIAKHGATSFVYIFSTWAQKQH